MTLGSWFKDYIFYPVTMSKPMKNLTGSARKRLGNHYGPLVAGSVALFCVWFSNGLWHGAAWSFIFFGMYHFVLILTGSLMAPAAKWFHTTFRVSPDNKAFQGFQILRTCVLVVIGELFFRADTLTNNLNFANCLLSVDVGFSRGFSDVTYLDVIEMRESGTEYWYRTPTKP
jgi:D-alanyl-lipoteichoic acid acyltransferase DltB (MBOAT superfamily)